MNIGNNIYKLRTAKNLSQGELAELLDVSRQSVSKWETDAAIPDLEKLMKLCDIFQVSLDEITDRKTREPIKQDVEKPKNRTSSTQRIIGYILFAFSLFFGFFVLLYGNQKGDFIILLPISLAIMMCGLLCLFAGEKAFYWCLWVIFAPITIFTPHLVGFSFLSVMLTVRLILIAIMCFIANAVFKNTVIQISTKKTLILSLAWCMPIALCAFHICVHTRPMPPYFDYNVFFDMTLNLICYVLIAGLETYTVCYIRNLRKK